MFYKVIKKYARGAPIDVATFAEINDAKLFIGAKLREDAALKVNVTYQLLEGGEVIEEFTQGNPLQNSSQSGGQQRSSGQSFAPTPFNTAPRPPGMPPNWVKDEDKKEK